MIYHYTDRESARRIIAAGLLIARPVQVWADLIGPLRGDRPTDLAPAVWFTASKSCSPTVLVRMSLDGWAAGDLWRFGIADETAGDLIDWAEPHQYSPALFRWMLITAQLAGEDFADWRLCPRDVPRESWVCVQSLRGESWQNEPMGGE